MSDAPDAVTELIAAREVVDDDLENERSRAAVMRGVFGKEMAPPTIGRYEIRERIGAGGLGVVYSAYDAATDREVAIKLIRRVVGRAPDTEARARMVREARALAVLEHPNVVSVFDAGEVDDQVFIAMELVDGEDMATWMKRSHPLSEVIHVFVGAGRGLAAAHAAGVVHRDFKPANVIIGRDGRVRVVDFGLAHPAHERGSASDGVVMGTPAYMAPEQQRGRATDARSDQFSFCIALWEAAFGVRPFSGGDAISRLGSIEQGNPQPPPNERRAPRWLASIVRRGLEANPRDRWPDMDDLVEQLLAGGRQTRRVRLASAIAAAALGGGAAFIAIGPTSPRAACMASAERLKAIWNEDRESTIHAAFTATGRGFADDTWSRVVAGLDGYSEGWSAVAKRTCELGHSDEGLPIDRSTQCLNRRLSELDALIAVLAEADADVLERAAEAVAGLRPVDRCADAAWLAARVRPPDQPAVVDAVERVRSDLARANALQEAGRYSDALEVARAAEPEAGSTEYAPVIAEVSFRIGTLREHTGDYSGAEESLAHAAWTAMGASHDEVAARAAAQLVFVLTQLGGRRDDAASWAKHAGAAIERVGPGGPEDAALSNALAVLALARRDLVEARQHHERALAIRQRIHGAEHLSVAGTLKNLGDVARAQGADDEATAYLERSLAMFELALGPTHPRIGSSLIGLGLIDLDRRRYRRARAYFERARDVLEGALGPDHPHAAVAVHNLAATQEAMGDLAGAHASYVRVATILEHAYGPESERVATALTGMGRTAVDLGRAAEAMPPLERALDIRTRAGVSHRYLGATRFALSRALWEIGEDQGRSRTLAEQALADAVAAGHSAAELRSAIESWLAQHRP